MKKSINRDRHCGYRSKAKTETNTSIKCEHGEPERKQQLETEGDTVREAEKEGDGKGS